MNSNTGIINVILIVLIGFTFHLNTNAQPTRYNFNPDWKLYVGDINGAEKNQVLMIPSGKKLLFHMHGIRRKPL
ncbi:hypothetical protein [Thalassobellus suaedae]|uniref:Uncharacterized protein n=1 Tax=Thalassobellus suaedae TaxID=3074124 RepID=A0ABY9XP68_9FLAO|nr:hypothetical protein RHP51_10570 [Flavobacteriaceae bacterium HL-DH14]WNH12964.1 hypothetical protein RHP49_01620 [Flavobacteriaceae bacterium HL-DH10]